MRRGDLQVTEIDIDVLQRALVESRLAANVSQGVYPTPAHEAAAARLSVRLQALRHTVTDGEDTHG